MFEIVARRRPAPAARILTPKYVLRRLRLVNLESLARRLRGFHYRTLALILAQNLNLHNMIEIESDWEWYDILREILTWCELLNWFEVDWEVIGDLRDGWMTAGEEYELEMAYFLDYIPVRLYGFSEEYFMNTDDEMDTAMILLAGLTDDLSIHEIEAGVKRDFNRYPSPLCWLPEMVQIAQSKTGNLILDNNAVYDGVEVFRWRWREDLARVLVAWEAAQPVIERFKTFRLWAASCQNSEEIITGLIREANYELNKEMLYEKY